MSPHTQTWAGVALGAILCASLAFLAARSVENGRRSFTADVQCSDGSKWLAVTFERQHMSWILRSPTSDEIVAVVPSSMCAAIPHQEAK